MQKRRILASHHNTNLPIHNNVITAYGVQSGASKFRTGDNETRSNSKCVHKRKGRYKSWRASVRGAFYTVSHATVDNERSIN